MPSVHDTAYPRLKAAVTVRDIAEVYTPTPAEQTLAATLTLSVPGQIGFLIVLKTFQRLGYFVPVQTVPQPIVDHIATHVGTVISLQEIHAYDASGTRRRHMVAIRSHLAIHPFDHATQQLLETVLREAAQTKDDLVDLINIGIEELIRQRYELPGFTTTLWIDAGTGRVISQTYRGRGPGGVLGEIVINYSDFRTVEGLSLPFKTTATFDGQPFPPLTATSEAITVNGQIDPSSFKKPSK